MALPLIGLGLATAGTIVANYIRTNVVEGSSLVEFGITRTNYCGPGYSGGQLGGDNYRIPSVLGSAVDAKCRLHDISYAEANGRMDAGTLKTQADLALVTDMLAILANPHLYTARDLELASAVTAAFLVKIPVSELSRVLGNDPDRKSVV